MIELEDHDIVVLDAPVPPLADSIDVVIDEGEVLAPLRARRLSSPEIEADVIDDVLASLDAEVARVRASDDFLSALESLPEVPLPPVAPARLAAAMRSPTRLPRVTAPPRSLRANVPPVAPDLATTHPGARVIPPPPESYSDLEDTTVFESTGPSGLLELAAAPSARVAPPPSGPIFVRGTESSGSVAPVAMPDTPVGTVVIRRKKSYGKLIAGVAATLSIAAAASLYARFPDVLPSALEHTRASREPREQVAARAIVLPLPAFAVGVGHRDAPAPLPTAAPKEPKAEEKTTTVDALPAARAKADPTVHIVHPTPAPKSTTKLPDGSFALGGSTKPFSDATPPKNEPKPAPAPKPEPPRAEPAKTAAAAPPASPASPKRALSPEQELAEAQLRASMK